jgi:hypothetical protein
MTMNNDPLWTVYRTRFLVRACQLTAPLAFTDPLGHQHFGQVGDYLVESSSGMRRIAPQMFFEDIYVPLEPSPPVEYAGSTFPADTAPYQTWPYGGL